MQEKFKDSGVALYNTATRQDNADYSDINEIYSLPFYNPVRVDNLFTPKKQRSKIIVMTIELLAVLQKNLDREIFCYILYANTGWGSIIGCLKTAKPPKFALLIRQTKAIFSHKLQPSVFFRTINILFKIAISCR